MIDIPGVWRNALLLRFLLNMDVVFYWILVRLTNLCCTKAWYLGTKQMSILKMSNVALCGVQLKDGKRAKDLTLMLSLNEAIDQLTVANSVHQYGMC